MKTLPNNEFSEQFTGDMITMDESYHKYLALYNLLKCNFCGKEHWRKKTDLSILKKCLKCGKEFKNNT